jgi:LysM repeat protein
MQTDHDPLGRAVIPIITMVPKIIRIIMIISIFIAMAPTRPVTAQSSDEWELMRLINDLRASHGLAAYTVDPDVIAIAQEHSTYLASIHACTHMRKDGRIPFDLGLVEDVASGDPGFLTPQSAIYDIWVMDFVHLKTLTGFATGDMGVGIASDGKTVYYTLDVRPGGTTTTTPNPFGTQNPKTKIPLVTLVTSTARPDGAIVHSVGYGQTLWTIARAYGVQIEQIRDWNNLANDSNAIYAGQKLLIRPASLATILPATNSMTATSTPTSLVSETPAPPSPAIGPTLTPIHQVSPTVIEKIAIPVSGNEHTTNRLLLAIAGAFIMIGLAYLLAFLTTRK